METRNDVPLYLYTYGSRLEETELCYLEMRSFFDKQSDSGLLMSEIAVHPDRSPFMRERIEVLYQGEQLADILEQVKQIELRDETFKVIFVKMSDLSPEDKIDFDQMRLVEREIGIYIEGEADMRNPDRIFGLVYWGGRYYFGHYIKSKAVWLTQIQKPRSYSIALSTRVARAAANIAVPFPSGKTAIDPCCGIGTVLVEALSMGIDIVGRDINHFVVQGTRENLAHFGLETSVICGDIADVTDHYDAAILDMPYNHFSTTTPEKQHELLIHARRIANKVIVITAETVDAFIAEAGFTIVDRCTTRKGSFVRQILVCV
ncbi:tRNA G10 N-methylase Trm11 [Paenibacillus endophyticus]|uniref:tRNA G10 N-methylase Trm11 n=1 Tax=Paenibacillus endophyticus TaxID=1294268 RepID=A0A7W5CC85_9BACL|nr:RNA methyltransferase [Paenibacillus endophyticus]MBB3155053.1 tRNA G10 N-methylase Trm11 [Paenibacillus endophyticus]